MKLTAELESFLVVPQDENNLTFHETVAYNKKTKENLQRWFKKRKINIRVIYTEDSRDKFSVLRKVGYITFFILCRIARTTNGVDDCSQSLACDLRI